MAAANPPTTPTTACLTLGRRLRRLRSDNRKTLAQVGEALSSTSAQMSRIETGQRLISSDHFDQLMSYYKVSGTDLDELRALLWAAHETESPWWTTYSDHITAAHARFLGFEHAAHELYEYQAVLVPALLQTERYARAVTAVGFASLGLDAIDALTEVKVSRQRFRLHETDNPLTCSYVVAESVLWFEVGGLETHMEQLQQLLTYSEHPQVSLRVIPYSAGADGTQTGAFSVFHFPSPDMPAVGFAESVATAQVLDTPRDLSRLTRLHRTLRDSARSVEESRDLIRRILEIQQAKIQQERSS